MNRWKLVPVAALMVLLSIAVVLRTTSSHSQDSPFFAEPKNVPPGAPGVPTPQQVPLTVPQPAVGAAGFGFSGPGTPVPASSTPVPGSYEPTLSLSKSPAEESRLRIIRLENASAESVHEILKTLFPTTLGMLAVDSRTNSLIIRAPKSQSDELVNLIDTLDRVKSVPYRPVPDGAPAGGSGAMSALQTLGASGDDLLRIRRDSPDSTAILKQQYEAAESVAHQLASTLLRDGSAATRHPELRQRVREAFAARQRLLLAELQDLQQRITVAQASINLRDRVADQIVDRRTSELLNPNLLWESESQPGTGAVKWPLNPRVRPVEDGYQSPPGMQPVTPGTGNFVPGNRTYSPVPIAVPSANPPAGTGLLPTSPVQSLPKTPSTLGIPIVPPNPAGAAPALPGSASWNSFRHDLVQTGVASSLLPGKLELLWEASLGDQIVATAAIVGNHVYVPCLSGELVCLERSSGTRLWAFKSGKAGFKSAPTVAGDSIYLGDEAGVFHAIDRHSGKGRWSVPTGGEIYSAAAIVDGRVVFGSYDNHLYCLKESDGSLLWKYETQGYVHSAPAVVDGVVLITGCDEYLRAIDIQSGKQKFEIPFQTYLIASPSILGDTIYVGTYASEVVAVDWKTKDVAWRYAATEKDRPFHSSAAVTDQLVVVGGRDKLVHAINRLTGQRAWTFPTRGKVDSSPVIVGDRVFIGSDDGNLYELGLANGKEHWKFNAGKAITAGPAVGEGVLVVGSESRDGKVYCFGNRNETISFKAAGPGNPGSRLTDAE